MAVTILVCGAFVAVAAAIQLSSILIILARGLFAPAPTAPAGHRPPVTVLRPVCGLENHLERTLRSGFELHYPDYEIVFCVAVPHDPVVPLVERLIAAFPHVPARLIAGDDRISINPKLNNLVKGWEAAAHPWIIMADSNVLMPPDYIDRLLARWDERTGLVCSPPAGSEPEGFAAEVECSFLNAFQGRWQLAADALGIGFAQGKTMLWRRDILDDAGGIRALAAEAAEDAAGTKIVRSRGLRVRLVDQPFPQPLGRRRLADVWRRQLRWARLRRVSFKLFFLPEILAGGFFPILLCTGLAATRQVPAFAPILLAAGWYGAEAILVRAMGWPISWRAPFAWLVRDALLPWLWIAAVSGSGFTWRGNAMNLAAQGAGAD